MASATKGSISEIHTKNNAETEGCLEFHRLIAQAAKATENASGERNGDFRFAAGPEVLAVRLVFNAALGMVVGAATAMFHAIIAALDTGYREALGTWLVGRLGGHWAWLALHMTLGATLSSLLAVYVARTTVVEALGTGIVPVKLCIRASVPIPPRVGAFRMVLSCFYCGLGNPLGIEAPILHVAAAIASSAHCGLGRWFPRLFGRSDLRLSVITGSAAGLSAAFQSPSVGVIYAMEEFLDVRQSGWVSAYTITCSLFATVVWRCAAGDGSSMVLNATHSRPESPLWPMMGISLVIGLMGGLLSAAHTHLVVLLRSIFQMKRRIPLKFLGCVGGFLAGCVGSLVYLITAYGCGKERGITGVFGPGSSSVSEVLQNDYPVWARATFLGGKLLACACAVATDGCGGLLMPCSVVGALLGSIISDGAVALDSSWDFHDFSCICGMAAMLGATMRLPLTGAVTAFEWSAAGHIYGVDSIMPVMASSLLGYLISKSCVPELQTVQDDLDFLNLELQSLRTFVEHNYYPDQRISTVRHASISSSGSYGPYGGRRHSNRSNRSDQEMKVRGMGSQRSFLSLQDHVIKQSSLRSDAQEVRKVRSAGPELQVSRSHSNRSIHSISVIPEERPSQRESLASGVSQSSVEKSHSERSIGREVGKSHSQRSVGPEVGKSYSQRSGQDVGNFVDNDVWVQKIPSAASKSVTSMNGLLTATAAAAAGRADGDSDDQQKSLTDSGGQPDSDPSLGDAGSRDDFSIFHSSEGSGSERGHKESKCQSRSERTLPEHWIPLSGVELAPNPTKPNQRNPPHAWTPLHSSSSLIKDDFTARGVAPKKLYSSSHQLKSSGTRGGFGHRSMRYLSRKRRHHESHQHQAILPAKDIEPKLWDISDKYDRHPAWSQFFVQLTKPSTPPQSPEMQHLDPEPGSSPTSTKTQSYVPPVGGTSAALHSTHGAQVTSKSEMYQKLTRTL